MNELERYEKDFEDDGMQVLRARENTILKLKKVFKLGYRPNRGYESYREYVSDYRAQFYVNCFGHSCFNLTNTLLDVFHFDVEDCIGFTGFGEIRESRFVEIDKDFVSYINQVGLEVESCLPNCQIDCSQEWKVALYFSEPRKDFHFMLQEKDHKWSSKMGMGANVKAFKTLPYKVCDSYILYDVKKITNPNSKRGVTSLTDNGFDISKGRFLI